MDYYGVGFSNIRLQNGKTNYIYKYDSRINTFPEEVFVHEFLHSLERTAIEYGYEIPALHDNEQYGYKNDTKSGLKTWYKDYMTQNILDTTTNTRIGLPKEVYYYKAAKSSGFKYSLQLDYLKESSNPFVGFGIALKNGITAMKIQLIGE